MAVSKNISNPRFRFSRGSHLPWFWTLVFVCWLITFNSFSIPGRVPPNTMSELDWIGVVKSITRILAGILLAVTLYRIANTTHKQKVMRRLFPLSMFGLWAILSTVWSPAKFMSLGHALEVPLWALLAAVTGILCVDNKLISRLLFHLSICALLYSLLYLILYYRFAYSAGGESLARSTGFNHPGNLGQVAGAGLLLLVACKLLWNWTWTGLLLYPALVIEGLLLFVTQARTSIFAFIFLLCICGFLIRTRGLFLMICLFFVTTSTVLLIMQPDPQDVYQPVVRYLMRGQTQEEFMTATRRTEVWAYALKSFMNSPLIGHGYNLLAPQQFVHVWGEKPWSSAHNILLHVLTGTGVIGGILLLWGLYLPLMTARRFLQCHSHKRQAASLVFIVVSFFFIIGCFGLSFLGQVGLTPLLFFVMLGIAAGSDHCRGALKNGQ